MKCICWIEPEIQIWPHQIMFCVVYPDFWKFSGKNRKLDFFVENVGKCLENYHTKILVWRNSLTRNGHHFKGRLLRLYVEVCSYSTDSCGGTLQGESADVQGSSGEPLLPLQQVLPQQPQPRVDRPKSLFNLTVMLASPGQDCHQFDFSPGNWLLRAGKAQVWFGKNRDAYSK